MKKSRTRQCPDKSLMQEYKSGSPGGQLFISGSNIVETTLRLIALVERYATLTGAQKKEMVISALLELVSEIADEDDPNESTGKIALENALTLLIPSVIDTFVKVEKSNLQIHPGCSKWFCCFP